MAPGPPGPPALRRAGVGRAERSAPLRRRGFGEVGNAIKAGCAWSGMKDLGVISWEFFMGKHGELMVN